MIVMSMELCVMCVRRPLLEKSWCLDFPAACPSSRQDLCVLVLLMILDTPIEYTVQIHYRYSRLANFRVFS